MPYPADFKYTKEHEWIKIEGTTASIGITTYAQDSLGDIVFVELPKVGAELIAGKTFGSDPGRVSAESRFEGSAANGGVGNRGLVPRAVAREWRWPFDVSRSWRLLPLSSGNH